MPVSKHTKKLMEKERQKSHRSKRYKKCRDNGLCVVCGKSTGTLGARCAECNVKVNAKECRRRKRYTDAGKCRLCGKDAEITNRSLRGKDRGNYCKHCWIKVLAASNLGSMKLWHVLIEKLNEYNWTCAYTGEKLILGINLSFDHMDPVCRFPERKHDPSNIVPCSWQVNLMKRDLTKDEFLTMIRSVYSYMERK